MHTIGQPPLAIVMGVCGAGKTVVGQALAARLTVPFIDGDDLHPQANIDKMTAGHSLDDSDRQPWLRRIGEWFREHHHTGGVVACSALKRSYRDLLRDECPEVVFYTYAATRQSSTNEWPSARATSCRRHSSSSNTAHWSRSSPTNEESNWIFPQPSTTSSIVRTPGSHGNYFTLTRPNGHTRLKEELCSRPWKPQHLQHRLGN